MKNIFLRPPVLKSFVKKEFKQILRDKRMVMMLFSAPVIMLFVFGYAVNTDVTKVNMAVLDSDCSSESRKLIQKFTGSGYFTYYASIESPSKADYYLDSWKADMYLHIPKDFKTKLASGQESEVQIIIDGSDSIRASVISAYINQIAVEFSEEYALEKIRVIMLNRDNIALRFGGLVNVKERIMFNPDLLSINFYLPGILALLVTLITIMLTSMSVVKERENGTMEQIIVSPLRSIEFVAGKTLPFGIISLIEICFTALITIFWFNVPFNGSFIFLLFSSVFYILATLAIGLFISTISQTQQQAMLSTFLFFIPSILFSGFIFPIYAMPRFFQYVTMLNPMTYYMTIIRGVFLKGVGISILWSDLLMLLIMSTVFIYFIVRRFNRGFE